MNHEYTHLEHTTHLECALDELIVSVEKDVNDKEEESRNDEPAERKEILQKKRREKEERETRQMTSGSARMIIRITSLRRITQIS